MGRRWPNPDTFMNQKWRFYVNTLQLQQFRDRLHIVFQNTSLNHPEHLQLTLSTLGLQQNPLPLAVTSPKTNPTVHKKAAP